MAEQHGLVPKVPGYSSRTSSVSLDGSARVHSIDLTGWNLSLVVQTTLAPYFVRSDSSRSVSSSEESSTSSCGSSGSAGAAGAAGARRGERRG